MAEVRIKKKEDSTQTVQEVAARMHTHYARTGTYRTEDLTHVLGDAKQSVSLTIRTRIK